MLGFYTVLLFNRVIENCTDQNEKWSGGKKNNGGSYIQYQSEKLKKIDWKGIETCWSEK